MKCRTPVPYQANLANTMAHAPALIHSVNRNTLYFLFSNDFCSKVDMFPCEFAANNMFDEAMTKPTAVRNVQKKMPLLYFLCPVSSCSESTSFRISPQALSGGD